MIIGDRPVVIETELQLYGAWCVLDSMMSWFAARAKAGRPDDVPLAKWQAEHDEVMRQMRRLRREVAAYLGRVGFAAVGLQQPGHAAGEQEAGHEEPAREHDPARVAELGVPGSGDPPQDPADEGNHQDNPAHHAGDVAPVAAADSSRARSRERAEARTRAIDGLTETFEKLVARYSLGTTHASLRVLAMVAYDDSTIEAELLRERLAELHAVNETRARQVRFATEAADDLARDADILARDLRDARRERDAWKSANDRGIKHADLLARELRVAHGRANELQAHLDAALAQVQTHSATGALVKDLSDKLSAAYRRGQEEHEAYVEKMQEIGRLMQSQPEVEAGSPDGERLRELAAEAEEYEQEHYPIGKPPTTRRT